MRYLASKGLERSAGLALACGLAAAIAACTTPEAEPSGAASPTGSGGAPAAAAPVEPYGAKDACASCHLRETPGLVAHWQGSTHAVMDVMCLDCHEAEAGDLDAFEHEGALISTIVTPKDCAECHDEEAAEFQASHHSKGGNILHSLDNLLAETVEGYRGTWKIRNPHDPKQVLEVNGLAFANSGCHQCHGSQIALMTTDGRSLTPWSLQQPPEGGKAVVTFDAAAVAGAEIARDEQGRPVYDTRTWPNTGIGRMNLDGSRGSCTACHSRHDFSARRARQPENCGKCHLGPDHPQKEIYEESKHGIAYRDLIGDMNLDGEEWVLGADYNAAPTCATCHMSATKDLKITHDPRTRISWNNRPAISVRLDTDDEGHVVPPEQATSTWQDKRATMKQVCTNCHTSRYVDGFYAQYDDFVTLYNEKYAKPGAKLMEALHAYGLISKANFDDEIEWTWFYLWHHEGRRGRHGASMMAPDYAHWHGTYEVAERWYVEFLPQAKEIIDHAKEDPAKRANAEKADKILQWILSKPWNAHSARGLREDR